MTNSSAKQDRNFEARGRKVLFKFNVTSKCLVKITDIIYS